MEGFLFGLFLISALLAVLGIISFVWFAENVILPLLYIFGMILLMVLVFVVAFIVDSFRKK